MRTRNQSKRPQKESGSKNVKKDKHDSESKSPATIYHKSISSNMSRECVDASMKHAGSHKAFQTKQEEDDIPHGKSHDKTKSEFEDDGKQKVSAKPIHNVAVVGSTDANRKIVPEEHAQQVIQCSSPAKREDMDELDWEDGSISISEPRDDGSDILERGVTVEFSDSLPSAKRKVIKRASAVDKEFAELVHKAHLLCLLARGRLVDSVCNDPLIQASLLSLLPANLLNVASFPKLTAKALAPIVNWFNNNFRVRSPDMSERSFKSSLAYALESHEGTAEEVAALSVALFRALNLTTRFVSILDVASLKPDPDMLGCSKQDASKVFIGISPNSFTKVAANHYHGSATTSSNIGHKSHSTGGLQVMENDSSCKVNDSKNMPATARPNNLASDPSASSACSDNETCAPKNVAGSKRKGDVEFELQIEMALNATSVRACESDDLNMNDKNNSSDLTSPSKGMKRIKTDESPVGARGSPMAIWSRKLGPPLYWAEVFCSGETFTGRWVHIDAANAVIDGEQKVEGAAAACKRSLRYVVAFAGHGAKDVTRRYCTKWYLVASQRINSQWWDAVLAPLKELESRATGCVFPSEADLEIPSSEVKLMAVDVPGSLETQSSQATESLSMHENLPGILRLTEGFVGEANKVQTTNVGVQSSKQSYGVVANRSSLEDIELETRALTEPLPTNQLAYRNHHLYVIERWLTKYQILHPKGPILGYCSGHAVYPRTCVQTLQTKQRWLKEGLQVKANESPAKVVKRSEKFSKMPTTEPNCEEDDGQGTVLLYGRWQMEPLNLPHAVNGIVPKNERGQVDVWSEKCLPPGTIHLRLPRLVPVVKRLGIDFAPAMVGFEFRNGHSIPVFEGIVVCSEFRDAIMEAYAEEEERREAEEKKREESRAISRWYQLLSNIVTRQRLKNSYEDGSTSQTHRLINQMTDPCGTQIEGGIEPSSFQRGDVKDVQRDYKSMTFEVDHEHVFPIENQSFDDESSVRTKRCPCGFSVQVEEM